MRLNLLLIVGLNNKAPKKFQHHVSVFGMYITANNADHPQYLAAEFFVWGCLNLLISGVSELFGNTFRDFDKKGSSKLIERFGSLSEAYV